MNLPRKFLKFDYYVHALFGVVMLCMLFDFYYTIYLMIYVFALLNAWQVLSALILGLGYGDKKRIYYLLAVVVYFVILWLSSFSSIPYSEYTIVASLGFAIWYAYLTYKDATYRTPSFWDLEF